MVWYNLIENWELKNKVTRNVLGKMGSQTIEIIRQGVWASFTGGWFYDPHQNIFCNAIHLYLFLSLLCTPFVTYLYFSKTVASWTVYCCSAASTIITVKLINLILHVMYDQAQVISENISKKTVKAAHENQSGTEDGGIEMQILARNSIVDPTTKTTIENNNNNSIEISQANSVISIEYPAEQITSTIDLKVEVHRKNSSESSDSLADVPSNESVTAQNIDRRSVIKEKSKSEDTAMMVPDATKEERRDKFLDADGVGSERINDKKRSKLHRQTSLDSSGPDFNNFPVRRPVSSTHLHRQQHHGSGFYHPNHLSMVAPEMYLESHFTTKSELAIERFVVPKKAPMRKDSTSTMSAIQLPTDSIPSTTSTTRQRRYSNTTTKTQQQLLTSGMVSVRRIKSTALEKCCPQPSYSNLSPHPNSVETINGLRNPPHAILPPPSKSLVRNQHLNFFPKGISGSIEPVYPIAENPIDEKSLNEGFILTSESEDDALSGSNDEEDDENDNEDEDDIENDFAVTAEHQLSTLNKCNISSKTKSMSFTEERRRKKTPDDSSNSVTKHSSELEIDRSRTHSTDSENEIHNGSQSPLLETRARTSIFKSNSPKNECDTKTYDKGIKTKKDGMIPTTPDVVNYADDANEGAVGGVYPSSPNIIRKSEEYGCDPSSDGEQASASSKDMLLFKDSKSTDRNWQDFNIDSNTISVDLTENATNAIKAATGSSYPQDQKLAKDTLKSLGAIPKSHFPRCEMNEEATNEMKANQHDSHDHNCGTNTKSLSHASSTNSLSGGSYNSSNSMNKNVLQIIQQTEDGWQLQSASPSNPYLVAQRGELLPVYNTRSDNIFSVPRKPYLYLHQQRQCHPKVRSTRNRMQNSSIDTTTASSRDEDDSMSMAGATGGSGSMGFDMKISERLSTLFFPELTENQTLGAQSTQRSTINRMTFADSMFWGHCNLPMEKKVQPKRYYKFPIKCIGEIKISMDRLQLLALFDRDCGYGQVTASILVGVFCSILGAIVLQLDYYRDIFAFIFCFVMAGSQYSLLKSVSPDASSSTHGDDMTRYSRPIYFCLCTSILIVSHHFSTFSKDGNSTLFGIPFSTTEFFYYIQEIMSIILLLFPLLFSFGLFAQVNTFLMYSLEQIDMHLFGGNAVCSLISAFLGVFKSIIACCMLYGFAFGGLSEPRSTQHVLFSCFCALLVVTSYHLSRTASDYTYLWAIIKSSFIINHDEDEELRRATKLSKFERNKPIKKNNEINIKTKISINNKEHQTGGNQTRSSHMQFDNCDASKDESIESVTNNSENVSEQAIPNAEEEGILENEDLDDPLPNKLKNTVNARLKNDFLMCTVIGTIVFSLHSSTVFTALQPELNPILRSFVIVLGFLLHYFIPQMRKYLPWLCFSKPILKQKEYGMYETSEAAKIMWFETLFVYLSFVEKNILLPLIFISELTSHSMLITQKFGIPIGSAIVVLCGLKSIRSSYSDPSSQYIIILFTVLFFGKDYSAASETFLINYFVVSIVFKKTCELLLKLKFIVTYIAPWQITWGSAFHAFAQPFSVPHSAMLFLQALISSILSAPLIPFLGSAIFLTSYTRPIKFWERDYNTRRIDHSNTRLSSHLERDLGADDNNLNSIFYEHLARSLQHSLCGDLLLGRWGNVSQGDCFVLASDYLNCLVHIIELGNGLCTFQMRGLEFRGTYCQQREVEAISEGVGENDGCCCCSPGHLPNCLSINAMFQTRWLAWQVVASQYILEGYSISDNLAQATLQVYEFRKVFITYYIKCIIYYTIRSPKLHNWLASQAIEEALQGTHDRSFVDLDPIFNHNLDEDFDFRASGITRSSFCSVYFEWILFCYEKRIEVQKSKRSGSQEEQPKTKSKNQPQILHRSQTENFGGHPSESNDGSPKSSDNHTPLQSPRTSNWNKNKDNKSQAQAQPTDITQKSTLISLLLALSLLARRTLATATHTHSSLSGVEFFLHGLHALFKGDYRITSIRDEWIFLDMDLLHTVVAPAVKMSLKLHQDHFLSPEEYDDPSALYTAITTHTKELVISHEADPLWRNAVLRGAPQLLALRHIVEEGSDEYRLIRLSKRYLSFRVIKLNRECVRGLWAGQQQELIYLRNRNPERGSIQNAKQALRNIINSSCDLPLGYPIYVSPLLPSYAETNEQLCKIVGGAITFDKIKNIAWKFCQHVRERFSSGCSSGSATLDTEVGDISAYYAPTNTPYNTVSATTGTLSYGSQSLAGTRGGSVVSMGKPNSTLLAGFLNRERDQERESINSDRSGMGVYRKRGSVITRSEQDRRATFPSSSPDTINNKEMGTSLSAIKSNISPETSMLTASSSRSHRPNSSFSSGNLSTQNTNRTPNISERKSKSEERQTSHDNDAFDVTIPDTKGISLSTSISLPTTTHTSVAFLESVPKYSSCNTSIFPSPLKISLNCKVIIVSTSEIYDCLDLGRKIDVVWPNECMRLAGGRSSWKQSSWEPKEGMIGRVVHFWQPNHANKRFRSNFINRTLFLVQIGDHFVPITEMGVKEYNTIGIDDRFYNVEVEIPADSDTILVEHKETMDE